MSTRTARPSVLLARTSAAFALLVLTGLAVTACGGGSGGGDPESLMAAANDAMGSGDYSTASQKLDAAIEALGADGPADMRYRARVNRARCTIRNGEGDTGKKNFLALVGEFGDRVDWKDYKRIGESLSDEDFNDEAMDVILAGIERFPDQKKALDEVMLAIASKPDLGGDAAERLKTLGYVD